MGFFPAHGFKDLHLAEGVGQMVVAADDVGDGHVVIVHHDGVEIGGRAVAAQDDHVIQLRVLHADLALDQIVHHGGAGLRDAQADDGGDAGGRVRGVAVPPASVVARGAAFGGGALAHFTQFFGAGVAAVGAAGGDQFVGDLGVAGGAGGLEDGRFVRVQAEPGEALEDDVHGLLGAALAVRVLDAEEELAFVVAGEEVVEEGGAGAADVEEAGGGWGEAGADHRRKKAFFFEKKNQKTFIGAVAE